MQSSQLDSVYHSILQKMDQGHPGTFVFPSNWNETASLLPDGFSLVVRFSVEVEALRFGAAGGGAEISAGFIIDRDGTVDPIASGALIGEAGALPASGEFEFGIVKGGLTDVTGTAIAEEIALSFGHGISQPIADTSVSLAQQYMEAHLAGDAATAFDLFAENAATGSIAYIVTGTDVGVGVEVERTTSVRQIVTSVEPRPILDQKNELRMVLLSKNLSSAEIEAIVAETFADDQVMVDDHASGQVEGSVAGQATATLSTAQIAEVLKEYLIGRGVSESDAQNQAEKYIENTEQQKQYCFPAGTPIRSVEGENVSIEEIVAGTRIASFHEHANDGRGELVPKKVVRTFVNQDKELISINGIQITPGHRVLIGTGEWKQAGHLVLGDHLVDEAGDLVEVTSIESVEGLHTVYNFEVEDFHTYVAAGIRVHNDSQQFIDLAGNVGQIFGTQIGQLIAEDRSTFERVVVSTVLGAVTRNIAEGITDGVITVMDGKHFHQGFAAQFDDFGADLASAGVGAVSAIATAEFFEAINFSGTIADGAAAAINHGFTSTANQVISNINAGFTGEALFSGISLENYFTGYVGGAAAGAFVGSTLARELYAAETLEGSIGGAVGGAVGSAAAIGAAGGVTAFAQLGFAAAFAWTGVGVFAGTLAGALIGDALVGGAPNPHVSAHLSYNQDGFLTVHIDPDDWSSDGERDDLLEYGRVMSDLTNASLNGAVEAMGSFVEVIDMPASMVVGLRHGEEGMKGEGIDPDWYDEANGVHDISDVVDAATLHILKNASFLGGDVLVKRAIERSIAQTAGTLSGDVAIAGDYANYLANVEVINSLLAEAPESAFALGWAATFTRIAELGLDEFGASDFDGGLEGYLMSLGLEALGATKADVEISMDADAMVMEVALGVAAEPSRAIMEVYSSNAEIIDNGDGSRTLKLTFADFESKAGFDAIDAATQAGITVTGTAGDDQLNAEAWRRRPSPESLLLRYRSSYGGYRPSYGGYRPSDYLSRANYLSRAAA